MSYVYDLRVGHVVDNLSGEWDVDGPATGGRFVAELGFGGGRVLLNRPRKLQSHVEVNYTTIQRGRLTREKLLAAASETRIAAITK